MDGNWVDSERTVGGGEWMRVSVGGEEEETAIEDRMGRMEVREHQVGGGTKRYSV